MSVLLFTAVLVTMTWPLHRYLRESYAAREENNRLLQDMTEQQQSWTSTTSSWSSAVVSWIRRWHAWKPWWRMIRLPVC
jgi:hypothetical protein